jgi:predicted small lipoprotein YifL
MNLRTPRLAALVGLLAFSACGDDGPRGIGPQDTTPADVGVDAAPEDTTTAPDGDTTPDLSGDTTVDPGPLPNACDDETPCVRGECWSGVCIEAPPETAAASLTDPATALRSDAAIELGCVDVSRAAPEQTMTTTVHGALARFGSGRRTDGLRVDFLLASEFDPTACEALADVAARKDCFRDLGPVLATTTTVQRTGVEELLPSVCSHHDECPYGYQCYDPAKLGGVCEEQFGVFEVEGIPLDTPLIVRATPISETDRTRWHDTWMFGVILNGDAEVEGRVQYDAQIVSASQWQLTTNSVGLSDIPEENGAIGGRVRDCQTASRPAWPIVEAKVGLGRRAEKVVYFNNLEDDTVPLVDRETTNIHGRFAALDIASGWNAIAGVARIDGNLQTLGAMQVYVFPDSLTIASWPGDSPFWRQTR